MRGNNRNKRSNGFYIEVLNNGKLRAYKRIRWIAAYSKISIRATDIALERGGNEEDSWCVSVLYAPWWVRRGRRGLIRENRNDEWRQTLLIHTLSLVGAARYQGQSWESCLHSPSLSRMGLGPLWPMMDYLKMDRVNKWQIHPIIHMDIPLLIKRLIVSDSKEKKRWERCWKWKIEKKGERGESKRWKIPMKTKSRERVRVSER